MNNILNRIKKDVNMHLLNGLWPGFKRAAFALYNDEHVYVFHHPLFLKDDGEYAILKWDEQFKGDTFILFKDYPTAIVNMNRYKDYESLLAVVVHELFHCYQYLNKESRFPNESLGFQYAITEENIELRNKERICLYDAVHCKSQAEKNNYIKQFIELREQRASFMKEEFITYECMVESIEGPAWYVEMNAYNAVYKNDKSETLRKYSGFILDAYEANCNIRKSCYSSGMLLCLLLDEIHPEWKTCFFNSDKSLYACLKQNKNVVLSLNNEIAISKETKQILHFVQNEREEDFKQFYKEKGYHLYIVGDIKLNMFNPMNVKLKGNKALHKTFLSVCIHNKTYMINQPVLASFEEDFKNMNQIHIIMIEKPLEKNNSWNLEGIGDIEAEYEEVESSIFLYLKS
ncbi:MULTISPECIES: peptide ABC transporter permease [Bacillus cereus group]|uniref:Peptide ABC transporter permease n=1 Tax=Bacillus cereus TaxID=1396 RepID=A0A2C0EMS6_BACCE|nr:peptide ABC transporter permease [Bacillus cereus]PDY84468.1 peptide ABC transporter permease [Bacillus cereus]PFA13917.1 peptide ABC transporter permease [Bacillus cereus]PFM38148.1 peptide ABC transporter permease [Bacillus cereus]PGL58144.1 peptide ABC transporter permease [Bacillus cereus]PGQ07170.1 peptide ABC transporter permease [Bacillus cereus]